MIAAVAGLRVVADEYLNLGVILDHHKETAHPHHVGGGVEYVDELQRLLHAHATGDVDKHAVLNEQRVEGHSGVGEGGQRAVIASDKLGMTHGRTGQGIDNHALGEAAGESGGGDKRVVDDKSQQRAEVGDVAAESCGDIDRDSHTVDIDAKVGRHHILDGCLLISLVATPGQHLAVEGREGCGATGVEQRRGMGVDRGAVVVVESDILVYGTHDALRVIDCRFLALSSRSLSPPTRGQARDRPCGQCGPCRARAQSRA